MSVKLINNQERTPAGEAQLHYLADLPRSGAPRVIPPGSTVSKALAETAIMDEEHQDMTFSEVAQELGISAARSTLEKVMHEEHKIHRCTPRIKPRLTQLDHQKRLNFAQWALHKLDEGVIFVFTDETWHNLGEGRR